MKTSKEVRMSTRDILLVDDDINYLHLLSMLLESEGYDVIAASDGINALKMLDNNHFRIMITDFNMPEINGVELATKAKEQRSDMRVVMVTASSMTDVAEAAADAGISKIFSKPLDLQRLLADVRSSLQAG